MRLPALAVLVAACLCQGAIKKNSPWTHPDRGALYTDFFSKKIKFKRPLWFGECPRDSGHFFVMEQGGRILRMVPSDKGKGFFKKEFLKIKVNRGPNEMGLLGLAFHPEYKKNRLYYINYNPKGKKVTVIEERMANKNFTGDSKNPGRVILKFKQPYGNHNGGGLEFGPSGYLYIGVGDGGKWGDPLGSGQDLTTLLGTILRIDVNNRSGNRGYGIPPDNPYVNATGKIKKEIFNSGLRNPWRFSFDPETGLLWIGDVGQNEYEEIHIARSGDNLGWNIMEGLTCYNSDNCVKKNLVMPVTQVSSDDARSITGGYVFRGNASSDFFGVYIFGDYATEKIWGLTESGGRVEQKELGEAPGGISSFGRDLKGNIYMTCFNGRVYRFNL